MVVSDAQLRAFAKYKKKTYRTFKFNLRYKEDKDLIKFLETQQSMQAYVISLIKTDYEIKMR